MITTTLEYTPLQKKRNIWFCGIPDLKIGSTSLRGQNVVAPFRCHGVVDSIFWAHRVPEPGVVFLLEGGVHEYFPGQMLLDPRIMLRVHSPTAKSYDSVHQVRTHKVTSTIWC